MIERLAAIVRENRQRQNRALEELAVASGISEAVLSALEEGRPGVTTVQLARVAAALGLDYAALLQGLDVPRPEPSVFLKHALNQDFDDRDSAALDDVLEQGRALGGLRRLLGDAPLALQEGVFTQRPAAADRAEAPAREGYNLAREVRRWLGDTSEPLGDLRADCEERFGVAVIVRPLQSNRVTAVGVRAEGAAAIALNATDPHRARNPLLARVYLAHELCHVLFDPSPGGLHIVLDLDSDKRDHDAEQRARAFAAELLLPVEGLSQLLGPPARLYDFTAAPSLVSRARSRFGTPHEIAANHLCNLGFVDPRLRDWLVRASTTFAGEPPPLSLPGADGPSRSVQDHVERAHRDGLVTDSEARRILGLNALARLPWDEVEL